MFHVGIVSFEFERYVVFFCLNYLSYGAIFYKGCVFTTHILNQNLWAKRVSHHYKNFVLLYIFIEQPFEIISKPLLHHAVGLWKRGLWIVWHDWEIPLMNDEISQGIFLIPVSVQILSKSVVNLYRFIIKYLSNTVRCLGTAQEWTCHYRYILPVSTQFFKFNPSSSSLSLSP